jgi:hypothetical protein
MDNPNGLHVIKGDLIDGGDPGDSSKDKHGGRAIVVGGAAIGALAAVAGMGITKATESAPITYSAPDAAHTAPANRPVAPNLTPNAVISQDALQAHIHPGK